MIKMIETKYILYIAILLILAEILGEILLANEQIILALSIAGIIIETLALTATITTKNRKMILLGCLCLCLACKK